MMTGERNRHIQSKAHFPLQILFHYWNTRSNAIPARLDQLLKKGINHVVSYVPWQAVESDISHQLTKFLCAAAERQFTVSLILTPEMGIPYPNSGLPKDLIGKSETAAVDTEGNPIWGACAPNVFPLPTLLSPEFQKRYNAYLSRLDHLLGTLDRPDLPVLKHLHFLLTGSFWKYYRSPRLSVLGPFLDKCAETSSSASIAYRKWLETHYAQPEFEEWDEIYSNDSAPDFTGAQKNLHDRQSRHSRWKTRAMDEINLRTFLRLSEEQFRAKNRQLTRKLSHSGAITSDIELFTPESDPSLHYATVAELLTGNSGAFQHLSSLIDDAGSRTTWIGTGVGPGQRAEPFLHWSSQGAFRGLTDPEKQFLILKSLLAVGSQGGAVLIHEEEWFSFSPAFRNRLEMFARSLQQREMRLKTQALYLSNHSWSKSGTLSNILWDDLSQSVGLEAKHVASPQAIVQDREAHLLFVDPSQVLTKDLVRRALAWMAMPAAGSGVNKSRLVVLPKTSLYTEAGLRELENALQLIEPAELDLGLPYQIYSFQEGKVILVEMPDEGRVAKAGGNSTTLWQKFLTAVLSLAEIESHCRTTDPSLVVLPLEVHDGSRAAFVLNAGLRPASTELVFSSEVKIADLAAVLTGVTDATPGAAAASHRFAIEIPPCGVMALSVETQKTHTVKSKGVEDGIGTKLEGVSRNIRHSGPEAPRSFPAQI